MEILRHHPHYLLDVSVPSTCGLHDIKPPPLQTKDASRPTLPLNCTPHMHLGSADVCTGYRCFYCCTAPRNPLRRSSASLAWHIHRCPKFAWPTAAPEQSTANKILFAWVPNSPINVAQFRAIHLPSADQLVDPAKDSEPPGAIPKVPYFPLAMNFRSRWPRESDESLPNFPANDACRSHF
jgi:hypothetical protein